ncbi:MAG TPA: Phenylacetic acid catabolic protein [Alphaproteobacteria bacterium]|nr:Phenylacetic acid catabolic protein [Alphaproteobacteria bacterium]
MNEAVKIPEYHAASEVSGDYRNMLVRLLTRQLWAETATAEVFGRSIAAAPSWRERFLAAEFTFEEAQHSQMLIDVLGDLGEDADAIIEARPDAGKFWHLDLDDWVHIAVFNFTVDRGGSQQIMEYAKSSYRPWADKMGVVLADEEEHYGNGVDNLRTFAKDPAQLARFQAVFDELLPNAVKRCFGRPEGADNDFCLAHGLKRNSTEAVVNRYLTEMRDYMAENGLKFPSFEKFETAGAELMPSTREIIASLQ